MSALNDVDKNPLPSRSRMLEDDYIAARRSSIAFLRDVRDAPRELASDDETLVVRDPSTRARVTIVRSRTSFAAVALNDALRDAEE